MNVNVDEGKCFEDVYFQDWKKRWKERLSLEDKSQKYLQTMKAFNPIVVPRNHKVEEALKSANQNNFEPINKLLNILKKPYDLQENITDYQVPPKIKEKPNFSNPVDFIAITKIIRVINIIINVTIL